MWLLWSGDGENEAGLVVGEKRIRRDGESLTVHFQEEQGFEK